MTSAVPAKVRLQRSDPDGPGFRRVRRGRGSSYRDHGTYGLATLRRDGQLAALVRILPGFSAPSRGNSWMAVIGTEEPR